MPKTPPHIASLEPYRPGKPISELQRELGRGDIIKLASNENPIGPSPRAIAAITAALCDLHRYPDGGLPLVQKIATRHQIAPENVIISNGSDSLILAVTRAYVSFGGEILTSAGSFPQYDLMPRAQGATITLAPLKNYHYDLDAIAERVTKKTEVIFLANPNNPTGTLFTRTEWDAFYKKIPFDTLIVLDEAYAEYVQDNTQWPDSMSYRYDNVLTLRTFSKAYGLAGIRLGYGMAHASIIHELNKVRLPFEPDSLAIAAGVAALDDDAFVQEYLRLVMSGREYFCERLTAMKMQYAESFANFVMIALRDATHAQHVFRALLADGIIVRPLTMSGLAHCLRITIGLPEENARCMDALARCIA